MSLGWGVEYRWKDRTNNTVVALSPIGVRKAAVEDTEAVIFNCSYVILGTGHPLRWSV